MALKLVFNPFTGTFDYVDSGLTPSTDGFSWYNIPLATTVTIDIDREMIVTSPQTISGTLIISGRNTIIV